MNTTPRPDRTGPAHPPPATLVRTVGNDEPARFRAVVRALDQMSPTTVDSFDASPLHAFVLAHEAIEKAFEGVGAVRANGDEPSRIHLSQQIRVHRLLLPDEKVTVDLRVIGARRDPLGVKIVMTAQVTGADGAGIAELTTGALLGGAIGPEPFGAVPPFPNRRSGAASTTRQMRVSAEGVRRWAEVSRDGNPIHLDDEAARAAGFDGAIAHGMCVLAMVSEEIIDQHAGGDPALVREIGVRFSTPVMPGEPVDVTLQPSGDTILFSCRTARGLALKSGWATLGDPTSSGPGGQSSGSA